jgi:hypothetical protein
MMIKRSYPFRTEAMQTHSAAELPGYLENIFWGKDGYAARASVFRMLPIPSLMETGKTPGTKTGAYIMLYINIRRFSGKAMAKKDGPPPEGLREDPLSDRQRSFF